MMYFVHGISFDSFEWELSPCERYEWPRHCAPEIYLQLFREVGTTLKYLCDLQQRKKVKALLTGTDKQKRPRRLMTQLWFRQATGQIVTATLSDTWQQNTLWQQQELRLSPKDGSLVQRQQMYVQSSTELNTHIHVQTSWHASSPPATRGHKERLGEVWEGSLGSCQKRPHCSSTRENAKHCFAPADKRGIYLNISLLANNGCNYGYHVLVNSNYPQNYKAFLDSVTEWRKLPQSALPFEFRHFSSLHNLLYISNLSVTYECMLLYSDHNTL